MNDTPRLIEARPGLWHVSAPHTMLGLHLGTRMTVVRLVDGLLLHSPVPIDDSLAAEVNALGPVRWVVCPNAYHHIYAGPAAARWPEARLLGPASLARKRRDLTFHGRTGEEELPEPIRRELLPVTIGGCLLDETVFLHAATGTVVSSDLVENFATSPHWPTRQYLMLAGIHGRPGWSRLLRWLYRDRAAARRDVERILAWDFDQVLLAHGDPLTHGAKDAVRATFDFLPG